MPGGSLALAPTASGLALYARSCGMTLLRKNALLHESGDDVEASADDVAAVHRRILRRVSELHVVENLGELDVRDADGGEVEAEGLAELHLVGAWCRGTRGRNRQP